MEAEVRQRSVIYLDETLPFTKHIKDKILKTMKGIGLLKLLSKFGMSYKIYVRSHLDHGDVIYHNQRI